MMPRDVIIDMISDQQQHSSALIQNNNGNDRSLTSTGVGAQEKSTSITDLLENKVAKMLGVLVCGWVLLVLVQGGMVGSLETNDCGFVTLLFFLVFFRCWRHYCPEAYRSFTDATQSLSADYLSIPNDIQQLVQQLALPSCYIRRLFYCSSLVSAMTSVVLSVMRLASQNFGKKEVENKESRDFALKVFYGLTLAEALVLLFAEVLSFPIRWNSVGLADGPGDDLEVGLTTRGNSVGLADGPGDGPEDGPVNQSNGVAQMALPTNQSNHFSLPILRQRRGILQKMVIELSMENARRRMKALKALKASARLDGVISTSIDGDKIVVLGYGINPIALTTVLRKNLGSADLISITSGENKKEEKTED